MLQKFYKCYLSKTSGATAVEFALIALPFILMLFTIMEVARIVWIKNGVEFAAKETVRYAAINSDFADSQYRLFALEKLQGMKVPTDSFNVASTTYTSSGVNFVEVQVDYNISTLFNTFLPFVDFSYDKILRRPVVE